MGSYLSSSNNKMQMYVGKATEDPSVITKRTAAESGEGIPSRNNKTGTQSVTMISSSMRKSDPNVVVKRIKPSSSIGNVRRPVSQLGVKSEL